MGQVRRAWVALVSGAALALALIAALLVMPSPSVAAGTTADGETLGCNQVVLPGQVRCFTTVRPPGATTGGVHSFTITPDVPHGVTPSDIATLYQLPEIPDPVPVGTSQTVALVEAAGYSGIESELASYRAAYGLGTCSIANRCLSVVNQDGHTAPMPPDNADWAWETMMDVEAVSAACPRCRILVVEAASPYTEDLNVAVNTAANRADYVSMSWGSLDDGMSDSDAADTESIFARHPHVTFVASTGDFGWDTDMPEYGLSCGTTTVPATPGDTHSCTSYPASSPQVIAAGGTMPVQADDGSWTEKPEEIWGAAEDDGSPNAGGVSSGCSGWTAMNAAQALNAQATAACGTSARGTADIAALADDFSLYHPAEDDEAGTVRHWWIGAGTSLAAPLLTALYARAGNNTSPFDIYQRANDDASAFTDITAGVATRGCPVSDPTHLCSAGVGWDGPTGLGTPHGLASLVALGSTVPPDQVVVYPNPTPTPNPALQPVGHAGKVKVKGKARVHTKLKAKYGTFETGATVTITWLVKGKAKPIGQGRKLRLKKAWLNRKIRYVVTASAAGRTPLSLTSPAVKVRR